MKLKNQRRKLNIVVNYTTTKSFKAFLYTNQFKNMFYFYNKFINYKPVFQVIKNKSKVQVDFGIFEEMEQLFRLA